MRIAVTGASGFVGGAVCRAAVGAGHEVRALGRRPHVDPEHVAGAGYRAHDLTDGPPDLAGADVVVHAAGAASDALPAQAHWDAHVAGTRAVLAGLPAHARLVHLSTASVYDPRRPTVRAREDAAPGPAYPDGYGAAKAAAERLVRATRPDAVILRPHAVYGPGEATLLPRLLAAVRAGRLVVPGRGPRAISLTRIDTLVGAVLALLDGPGGTYNVADAEPVELLTTLTAVLAARGVRVRTFSLPVPLAHSIAIIAEATARICGTSPVLSRYAVRHVARERTLDVTTLRDRSGYDPPPTDVADAAHW
ncbi:NAD-dependent epimerase [Actinomycetospora sp. NBRC 106375]|uniref:NAD-dependent epimerase/dehydratase family protein n=1 Tax=Actinomycetospora sp. NBRC 106375 TaxID=3032207 RepID=UPI0024A1A932|nr:NAD-dependent epimerase/dehydratase family protein [Actinomycetospora sp. NBRC 106375]GLZ50265.1 NAD-dependent epimerase [Actinomycetospora sp. NBRC 106375]